MHMLNFVIAQVLIDRIVLMIYLMSLDLVRVYLLEIIFDKTIKFENTYKNVIYRFDDGY